MNYPPQTEKGNPFLAGPLVLAGTAPSASRGFLALFRLLSIQFYTPKQLIVG
jgi:hypothetical protein